VGIVLLSGRDFISVDIDSCARGKDSARCISRRLQDGRKKRVQVYERNELIIKSPHHFYHTDA
jgi:hypothetical protein